MNSPNPSDEKKKNIHMNSPNPSDKKKISTWIRQTRRIKKNPPWRAVSQICGFDVQVACVASVSNRVRAGAKKKKKMERGRGGKKRSPPSLPFPSPVIPFFFCSRPNFPDELARKRLLRRLMCRVHWVRMDGRPIRIKKSLRFQKYTDSSVWTGPSNTVRIVVVFTEK